MSDRLQVLALTVSTVNSGRVELFMDGQSGTWRLFLHSDADAGCIDFTLNDLQDFHRQLSTVLTDIDTEPEENNAEVRQHISAQVDALV